MKRPFGDCKIGMPLRVALAVGIFTITNLSASSQSNFVKIHQPNHHGVLTSVIQTGSNFFLAAGPVREIDGGVFTFLIKTDLAGELVWKKKLGNGLLSNPWISSSIIEVEDGFIIMSNVLQDNRPVFYKVDEEGAVIWKKPLNGPGIFRAFSANRCADGGFIIAGDINQGDRSTNDIIILRTDSKGNVRWQKEYGLINQEEKMATAMESPDGGFIISASTTEGSSLDFPMLENVLIFKTDRIGNVLWKKIVGRAGPEQNLPLNMVRTHDQLYALVMVESISNNVSMLKFTEAGEIVWYKQVISPWRGVANQAAVLPNGNFILTGYIKPDFVAPDLGPPEQVGVWVVSPEGNLISQKKHVIGLQSFGFGITVQPNGNPVIVGSVMARANFSDVFIMGIGPDGCLMKDPDLGDDIESCGEEVSLNVAPGFKSHQWNTGSTAGSLSVNVTGVYSVTVENEDRCFRTDSVTVTFKNCILRDTCKNVVYNAEDLFVPNVITPNDDEKNEYFKVSENVQGSSLKIFNRWGTLVYHKEQYNNDWNGGDLSTGNYYYVIKNTCFTKSIKGNLMIAR